MNQNINQKIDQIISFKYGSNISFVEGDLTNVILKYSNPEYLNNNKNNILNDEIYSTVIVKKVSISYLTSFLREIITLELLNNNDFRSNNKNEPHNKLQSHPNIIQMKEAHLDFKYGYIVEEYINNQNRSTLDHYLPDFYEGNYSLSSIKQIFYDLGVGLALLRNYNILYRDLKPDNILLYPQNKTLRAKLIDFGLSRKSNYVKSAFSTSVYTHNFKAPELLVEEEHTYYGYEAEIWSLAITIIYVIKGSFLFDGSHEEELLISIENYFKNPQWNQILAKDWLLFSGDTNLFNLLQSMLILVPNQRIDIFQYLASPFFDSNNLDSSNNINFNNNLNNNSNPVSSNDNNNNLIKDFTPVPLTVIGRLESLDYYPNIYPFRKNRPLELLSLIEKVRMLRLSNYSLCLFIYDSYFSSFFQKDPATYSQFNQQNEKLSYSFEMAIITLVNKIHEKNGYFSEQFIPQINSILQMINYKVHVNLINNFWSLYSDKYSSTIRSDFFNNYRRLYYHELSFYYKAHELTLVLIERLCQLRCEHFLDLQTLNTVFKDSFRLNQLRNEVSSIIQFV